MTLRTRLQVESLDDRCLPSALASPPPAHHHHALTGRGTGDASRQFSILSGSSYELKGVARLAGLGPVIVQGSVRSAGLTLRGYATGTLNFGNPRGSVTVALTGLNRQTGMAPVPNFYHYVITSGRKAFRGMTDEGTIRLDIHTSWLTSKGHFGLAI